ncbi:MAG: hypothetical protein HUU38_05490 [Anaerolineales bacterium]|nr:hypothetical protein [Anaerolineales bacterium]
MTPLEMKKQITSLLDSLTDTKLAVILDFTQYLAERDTASDWLTTQMQSKAYQDWTSEENDVYDEGFTE